MTRKTQYILLVVFLSILLFIAGATVASFFLEPELEEAGIREIGGVLYYPDGQPVRNYEQLGIYLDAEKEVK